MVKVVDVLCSFCWSIIWFIIFFIIVFFVGFIGVMLYVIVFLFNVCCSCIKSFMDFFKKGIEFLYDVVNNMVNGK